MKVRGKDYRAAWMEGRDVVVINQRLLPHRFALLRLKNHHQAANAIQTMVIRGAGTIGATAGFGLAQACLEAARQPKWRHFSRYVRKAYAILLNTRPTAADLKHALDRVLDQVEEADDVEMACSVAVAEAERIADEYVERARKIAEAGLPLIRSGSRVLTHCNAGWLALVDWGSATAPIYLAHRRGRKVFVWVDETRPRNQGAGLTSWELLQAGVPHAVIADNAGGLLMRRGEVDLCLVGADRIAANGDVANKIGTYQKAVLARENGIPFYVAAPLSTVDLTLPPGDQIPIEERSSAEVTQIGGVAMAPAGVPARHPAFDVTPHRYITAIITEKGIAREPFKENLEAFARS